MPLSFSLAGSGLSAAQGFEAEILDLFAKRAPDVFEH
jgi:hypothetical protein